MQTKATRGFVVRSLAASPAPPPDAAPTIPDLDTRARHVMIQITAREAVRIRLVGGPRRHRWYNSRREDPVVASRALTRIGEDLMDLKTAGATEAEVRLVLVFIESLITELWLSGDSAAIAALLHQADRREQEVESVENNCTIQRLTSERLNPVQLEREAEVGDLEVAVQQAKNRLLRELAQQLRAGDGPRPTPIAA